MAITLYGIPSCGTVKKALAWLNTAKVVHTFVDYRAVPPTRARIESWITVFGSRPLRNTSGGAYRALGPEKDTWTDAQWADAFVADPMLIKRPVVERDGKAVIVGWNLDDSELRKRIG